MFGSQKTLRKEKNRKIIFIFNFIMKKYKIKLNIIKINKKLYIFKLFNFYERNK